MRNTTYSATPVLYMLLSVEFATIQMHENNRKRKKSTPQYVFCPVLRVSSPVAAIRRGLNSVYCISIIFYHFLIGKFKLLALLGGGTARRNDSKRDACFFLCLIFEVMNLRYYIRMAFHSNHPYFRNYGQTSLLFSFRLCS